MTTKIKSFFDFSHRLDACLLALLGQEVRFIVFQYECDCFFFWGLDSLSRFFGLHKKSNRLYPENTIHVQL